MSLTSLQDCKTACTSEDELTVFVVGLTLKDSHPRKYYIYSTPVERFVSKDMDLRLSKREFSEHIRDLSWEFWEQVEAHFD